MCKQTCLYEACLQSPRPCLCRHNWHVVHIVLACRLFPVPWWGHHLGRHDGAWWLRTLQPAVLHSMPTRQRLGVLNAAHDLVNHLGHKLKPFLPEVCALVMVLLQGSSLNSDQVKPASLHVLQILAVFGSCQSWDCANIALANINTLQKLCTVPATV